MEVSRYFSRLLLACSLMVNGAHADFEDLNFDDVDSDLPVVLTAVRLKQLQSDVPASVTVLHGQMLLDMGVRELSEALRLVPGMMVGYDATNKVSVVQYHGGPASLPRNLQVLLDGRSVYQASISAVDWQNIPVAMEDIDRIEVVRGPNSSSYGSNAFQAIVNILTKHSADIEGSVVSHKRGDNGVRESFARYRSQLANTDMRFSLLTKQDDGIAKSDEEYPYQSAFLDAQINHRFIDGSDLTFTAIYQEHDKPLVAFADAGDLVFEVKEKDVERAEIGARWEKSISSNHKIKVNSFVSHADHRSRSSVTGDDLVNILLDPILADWYQNNPELLASLLDKSLDLTQLSQEELVQVQILDARYNISDSNNLNLAPFSGEIDNSLTEARFDVEIQDTLILNNNLTLVSGVGFRRDISHSESFFNGYASNNISRAFSSMDWDSLGDWKVHIGLMWEKESNLEAVFNPRAAVIYRLGYNQSLRAVIAKSVRSPDMFETQTQWRYQVQNLQTQGDVYGDTFYQQVYADDNLRHEKILSRELGYYYLSMNNAFELDVRLFHEELSDMLNQNLALDNWQNENGISMFFRGLEYQASYKPLAETHLRMTAAFIEAGSEEEEDTLLRVHAKHTGSLAWIQRWPHFYTTSVGYYLADNYNDFDDARFRTRFERLDLRLAKRFQISPIYELDTSVAVQKDLSDDGIIFRNVKYNDATRYLMTLALKF